MYIGPLRVDGTLNPTQSLTRVTFWTVVCVVGGWTEARLLGSQFPMRISIMVSTFKSGRKSSFFFLVVQADSRKRNWYYHAGAAALMIFAIFYRGLWTFHSRGLSHCCTDHNPRHCVLSTLILSALRRPPDPNDEILLRQAPCTYKRSREQKKLTVLLLAFTNQTHFAKLHALV